MTLRDYMTPDERFRDREERAEAWERRQDARERFSEPTQEQVREALKLRDQSHEPLPCSTPTGNQQDATSTPTLRE